MDVHVVSFCVLSYKGTSERAKKQTVQQTLRSLDLAA